MPKLYLMDDYDLCMDKDNLTIYCITTVIIKPNASLELWEYIDQFSRNRKKHFRHDRLQRGVCVNKCQVLLEDVDQETLESLYQPEFEYENEVGHISSRLNGEKSGTMNLFLPSIFNRPLNYLPFCTVGQRRISPRNITHVP